MPRYASNLNGQAPKPKADIMILGINDQNGKNEAANPHDDNQERPAKASLWARMEEKTAMALAVVWMNGTFDVANY